MKRTLAILAGIAALALALTSTASAADGTLAAIGQKSSTASLAFTKCLNAGLQGPDGNGVPESGHPVPGKPNHGARQGRRDPSRHAVLPRGAAAVEDQARVSLSAAGSGMRVSDRQFIDAQIRFLEQSRPGRWRLLTQAT